MLSKQLVETKAIVFDAWLQALSPSTSKESRSPFRSDRKGLLTCWNSGTPPRTRTENPLIKSSIWAVSAGPDGTPEHLISTDERFHEPCSRLSVPWGSFASSLSLHCVLAIRTGSPVGGVISPTVVARKAGHSSSRQVSSWLRSRARTIVEASASGVR